MFLDFYIELLKFKDYKLTKLLDTDRYYTPLSVIEQSYKFNTFRFLQYGDWAIAYKVISVTLFQLIDIFN